MIGVDEAGKGPVLGSMFVAAVEYDGSVDVEVADSKKMSAESRSRAAEVLRRRCGFEVVEIPVSEIDAYVDGDGRSMNDLVVEAHAEALTRLGEAGAAVVDASDTDEDRFGRRVADETDVDVDVTARHGADDSYPAVSAASVVAKVARDRHVDEVAERYGVDVGSGYPGDSRTREFLAGYVEEEGELPQEARESWSTSEDVLDRSVQSDISEF